MTPVDANTPPVTADRRSVQDESFLRAAARQALFRWAEVISLGQIDAVLALYAPDAILVPTLSDEIREREEERRRYFEAFLSNENLRCTITHFKIRISLKMSTVIIGGLYTFHFRRNGHEEVVPARVLFTFGMIDGRWLITGHHSSRMSDAV
jgi:hypothetical protein